jgi:RNA polymerase sigma-70 factor (ECF subfamily)
LTDQQLVVKILRGDTNAFSAIIKNTESLVAQIVFKMINNIEDRKDIVQDIYLKTYKNLSGFKFQSKLSTWIAQISYNTCLNYLEKKKLVFPENFPDDHEKDEDGFGTASNQHLSFAITEKIITRKELSKILASEIEMLSPVYKTLITLYHNEELSYEEISVITELPTGTVKSYLFRARKSLKESLLSKYKKEEL